MLFSPARFKRHSKANIKVFFISTTDSRPLEGYVTVCIPRLDHQIILNHPGKDVKRVYLYVTETTYETHVNSFYESAGGNQSDHLNWTSYDHPDPSHIRRQCHPNLWVIVAIL